MGHAQKSLTTTDLLAFTEYVIASFVEKYQWTARKLFFDDRPYPNQEIYTCYILLKDMPNVEAIKYNDSIFNPLRTDKMSECNPRQLVKTETKNEHEVLVRIPGLGFELGYESLCKAYLKGQVPRSSMQRNCRELINQNPMSRFINANWFSLNIDHIIQQNNEDLASYTNISSLETMQKMMLSRFDNQYNYTIDRVQIYEQYGMKRRIFDSLVKQIDDQMYPYQNVSRKSPSYRKMVRFNQKGQQAHDNQQWLIKIIKRHAQILR